MLQTKAQNWQRYIDSSEGANKLQQEAKGLLWLLIHGAVTGILNEGVAQSQFSCFNSVFFFFVDKITF